MRTASDTWALFTCPTCGSKFRTRLAVVDCPDCRAVSRVTLPESPEWLESSETEFWRVREHLQRHDPAWDYYGAFRVRWMTGVAL